jgi:hypothetical protein
MLSTFRCCSCSVTCCLPEYTDRTVSAKTWLANKLHNKNIGTLTSAQWSNLGQLKSSLGDQGPVQVDAATLASHKFVNWLHGNAESNSTHPHNFSVVPMERPGFKSEGTLSPEHVLFQWQNFTVSTPSWCSHLVTMRLLTALPELQKNQI